LAKELGVYRRVGSCQYHPYQVKESRDCLLKVEVTNVSSKKQILSKAKLLRQAKDEIHRKVYITPDLSYQERIQQKTLRSELHRRRSAGESNLSIRKGQIVTIQTNAMEVGHNPSASSNNNSG